MLFILFDLNSLTQNPKKMKLKAKTLFILQCLIGFLLLTSTTTFAEPAWCKCFSMDNWYVSGSVAVGLHNDTNFSKDGESINFEYETGFGNAFAFGLYICPVRLEIEGSFRRNDLDQASAPNIEESSSTKNIDGSLNYWSFMFNGYYDYFINDNWSIYLGGGIGITWAKFDIKAIEFPAGSPVGKHTNAQFAWQIIPGIAYEINCRVTAYAGYRLFGTSDVSANNIKSDKVALLHNIETGIRLTL